MPSGAAYADMYELALGLRQREADLLVISDMPEGLALARRHFRWRPLRLSGLAR